MMIEEQSPTVEVAASRLVVTDDYAVEDPPVEDAAPAPLKDHPLVPRILEEVGALNNWVSLNREWDVTCRKFTLANKVSVIATTEHYLRAVHVSGATFLNEIRFVILLYQSIGLC